MKLTRSREWNEIEGIFLNFLLFWYKYEPFVANSSLRFVQTRLSALFRLLSTPLFINSCDFKKSQDFEIVKILELILRNLLQLLYYETIQIFALTLGKWGSQPSHINTTVHNEHLILWHETTEPVRLLPGLLILFCALSIFFPSHEHRCNLYFP